MLFFLIIIQFNHYIYILHNKCKKQLNFDAFIVQYLFILNTEQATKKIFVLFLAAYLKITVCKFFHPKIMKKNTKFLHNFHIKKNVILNTNMINKDKHIYYNKFNTNLKSRCMLIMCELLIVLFLKYYSVQIFKFYILFYFSKTCVIL